MTPQEFERNKFIAEASCSFASILYDLMQDGIAVEHQETRTERDKDKFTGLIVAKMPDDNAFDYYGHIIGKMDVNLQLFPTRALIIFERRDV